MSDDITVYIHKRCHRPAFICYGELHINNIVYANGTGYSGREPECEYCNGVLNGPGDVEIMMGVEYEIVSDSYRYFTVPMDYPHNRYNIQYLQKLQDTKAKLNLVNSLPPNLTNSIRAT